MRSPSLAAPKRIRLRYITKENTGGIASGSMLVTYQRLSLKRGISYVPTPD